MHTNYEISASKMDQINILTGKIMGIGSFMANIQPKDLPVNGDDVFSDCGDILYSVARKIQEIIGDVQKAAMT